jgi:hypothetical protein
MFPRVTEGRSERHNHRAGRAASRSGVGGLAFARFIRCVYRAFFCGLHLRIYEAAVRARPGPLGKQYATLEAPEAAQLLVLVRKHGYPRAAKLLGVCVTTLERLDGGGYASPGTVARVAARLRAVLVTERLP